MRIRQKPVGSTTGPHPLHTIRHHRHVRKRPDAFEREPKWQEHMENAQRADQHTGARPKPVMSSKGGVRTFENAAKTMPAPGVVVHALLNESGDPAVRIERVDVDAGRNTPETRTELDRRTLVHGSGSLVLNGVRQDVAHGDLVLLPKGTKFSFEATGPMTLWSVGTPSQEAPMKRGAGVLNEDPTKEFFVGEGVHVLERANHPADPSVGFDRIRAPAGMTTALHKLKIDERYLITKGEADVEIDGVKQHVRAGDVVLFPRESTQRLVAGDGGVEFYSVTTPRFLVEDFEQPLADAFVDPAKYDGSAGELAALQAKIRST